MEISKMFMPPGKGKRETNFGFPLIHSTSNYTSTFIAFSLQLFSLEDWLLIPQ